MTLETDLSRKPYFDDFSEDKNFHEVLFRPAAAVQARELNQTQSILQDQINKFGRHIFKDGSVVEGCAFTFDINYDYVKIEDNYANNFAISNVVDLNDKLVRNANGLEALVINTVEGFQSQNPDLNTLYIKYLKSATYPNGSIQSVFANGEILQVFTTANVAVSNAVVATVANSTGKGYAFTTTEGVIFKKGFFIRVEPQTLIVTKYNNQPNNVSVGFDALEEIITPEIDTSLLDNAAGSPNYEAPGAHRLKLIPSLITRVTSSTNTASFFSVCDFQNGLPVSIKNDPQYAALGREQARRTYETSGDYVVSPFFMSASDKEANTTHLNLVVSPGVGYIKGNRIEFINNNTVPLRKGLDYNTVLNQVVSTNFGYYFEVKEYCGDFNNDQIAQIEIHSVAKTAITARTFLDSSYSTSTKIGTAYVRGVSYDSGIPGADATYLIYIFNLRMDPGFSISNARSLILYNSTVKAVADIVLTYDAAVGADVARIQESTSELMVFPFGQKAIKADGITEQQFTYRNKFTTDFTTSGNASVGLGTSAGSGTDSIIPTGTYSATSKRDFIVVPNVNGFSTALNGGITAYSSNTLVVGNATATFTTDYVVGDYIFANNETRRIVSIVNNTNMNVDAAFNNNTAAQIVHKKTFPAGVPINLAPSTRTIVANSTIAAVSLGQSVSPAFSSTFYFNVNRDTTAPIGKTIIRNALIKINLANNAAGATGPWCLGLPDVFRINHVYVGATGSYSNTNPDLVSFFTLDNGQKDAYYDLAYLTSNRLFSTSTSFLVDLDHFTFNTSAGVGFFTAKSYPIDDANTANTNAIQTYQIPTYISRSSKQYIDLRDAVDFRSLAENTAVSTTTVGSATINPTTTLTLFSYGSAGSFIPTPDSSYEASSIQYYLPRKDRISLSTSGDILITEGGSSTSPVLPGEPAGTMTIGTVDMSPYPSLDIRTARRSNRYDYAVQVNSQQTKRYTMSDIGTLAKRIDNLEYYTSLSLLEQAATNLLVRSGSTGENRFKNGFLVDPFRDHTIGNTLDKEYNIAVDANKNELRPAFAVSKIPMVFNADSSSNIAVTGSLLTLTYNNNVTQVQKYASSTQSLTVGNVYGYRGRVVLSPAGATAPDYGINPDVLNNVDLYSNWVNLDRAWNSQWGAWTAVDLGTGPSSLTTEALNSQTTTTIDNQTQLISSQLTTQPTDTNINVGEYVTNVSIAPYLKSQFIYFRASGMKPFARLYPFFADSDVSAICMPLKIFVATGGGPAPWTLINGTHISDASGNPLTRDPYGNVYEYDYDGTTWGSAITADTNGDAYGVIRIPPRIFKAAELEFKLIDTPTLTLTGASTQASAIFYGTALSVQKQKIELQIRPVVNITQEITEITNIQQTIVNNITNNQNVVQQPSVILPPINSEPPWSPSGSDSNSNTGEYTDTSNDYGSFNPDSFDPGTPSGGAAVGEGIGADPASASDGVAGGAAAGEGIGDGGTSSDPGSDNGGDDGSGNGMGDA